MSLAIEIEKLHYKYPDGTVALRGISLGIEQGQCVGLIGPNGAGKSTLMLHLNGLLPEHITAEQPIQILGDRIGPANLQEIRRLVGVVFQDANDQLFCPTVFEDVAFGPRQLGLDEDAVADRVTMALKQVGLAGLENRPPHHLSGGQKRRVCIASVLSCEADILVLDEPTADLDPRGRRELKDLLRQLTITRLLATHDLELVAELCDQVIVMDAGEVVASGPCHELLQNEELMLKHGLEVPHILRHLHPHQ